MTAPFIGPVRAAPPDHSIGDIMDTIPASSGSLLELGILALIVLFALFGLALILVRLYRRAEKDRAFVRTGFGGMKVIIDGGAIVLPILHQIRFVNLRTLRLEVRRDAREALITKDRLRVDIFAEFFVRVKPEGAAVALAAQTLGDLTGDPDGLRSQVEAKLVDGLRAVAATMTLDELHENREIFVKAVLEKVQQDLQQNGIELESVAVTRLDQTSKEFLNPDNAFDAEGLTRLTEITEDRRRRRNETEQHTRVAIEQRNFEAEQQSLQIRLQSESARAETEKSVAEIQQRTQAEIAEKEADATRRKETVVIQAQREVEEKRIEKETAVGVAEQVKSVQIAQAKEKAIHADAQVAAREQEAARVVKTAEIETNLAVETRAQEAKVAVAIKSKEVSDAAAEAEAARARMVQAEENVKTTKVVAEAERDKQVAVIAAARDAEQEKVRIVTLASADQDAATARAEAKLTEAKAEAEAVTIRAEAKAKEYAVEAEGTAALNEARNRLGDHIVRLEVTRITLDALPGILEQVVKPAEKIGNISIVEMGGTGLGGGAANANGIDAGGTGAGGSLPDQILQALMRYQFQAPLVQHVLNQAGVNPANLAETLAAAGSPAPTAAAAPSITAKAAVPDIVRLPDGA